MQPSRARLQILALLTVGTMINYLDRTVISVAAPSMSTQLALSPELMGVIFSAFSWSYATAQVPAGVLLDRIGVRLTYFLSVTTLVRLHTAPGLRDGLRVAHRLSHRTRYCRSALLPEQ